MCIRRGGARRSRRRRTGERGAAPGEGDRAAAGMHARARCRLRWRARCRVAARRMRWCARRPFHRSNRMGTARCGVAGALDVGARCGFRLRGSCRRDRSATRRVGSRDRFDHTTENGRKAIRIARTLRIACREPAHRVSGITRIFVCAVRGMTDDMRTNVQTSEAAGAARASNRF